MTCSSTWESRLIAGGVGRVESTLAALILTWSPWLNLAGRLVPVYPSSTASLTRTIAKAGGLQSLVPVSVPRGFLHKTGEERDSEREDESMCVCCTS